MKKRICFVGFANNEPEEFESLKQAMSGISGAWDCLFVSDGPAALAAMAAGPFDAVVTKMHLAGMNGAELLQQAGRLHPQTLRFVLGDVGDQELIINCIGGTHQFIARPCQPRALISTIQRSLALDAWLASDQLRTLAPRLSRLPSLPSTYFEVLKQIESPNASVQSIGEVIARDPVVTARLLQMVNSAAFALSQKVTDPAHAVSLLGMETVKSLVLCLQVFSQCDQARQAGLSFEYLWDHSSSVANISRRITSLQTGDTRMANDAFTAGLLHDVGRIVLASNLSQEYAAVVAAARQQARPLHEEETAQLGVTHAQVGAYLLGLWGMPAPLVEAAALHHTPSQASTREFSLLTAVHAANVLAHEQDTRTQGLPPPALDLAHLNQLGLANRMDAWRKAQGSEKKATTKIRPTHAKPTSVPAPARVSKPVPAPAPALAKATAAAPRPDWFRRLLIPASAVLVIAAILYWWPAESDSGAYKRVHAQTVTGPARAADALPTAPLSGTPSEKKTTANDIPTAAQTPAAATPASGFDSVKVQAIFYRVPDPSVMINGKTLNLRERINGLEVVAIERSSVTLASSSERRVFTLK